MTIFKIMKKKEIEEKLIAAETMIGVLKKELEKLESEETEFKVGEWYNNSGRLFCYGKNKSYGIYEDGVWSDDIKLYGDTWRKATPKEVEEALIKEAIKRGFKDDTVIKISVGANEHIDNLSGRTGGIGEYYHDLCALDSKYANGWIFYNGKWAEIIQDTRPTINGHEMEIDGDIVKFGCAKFEKGFFDNARQSINNLNEIYTFSNRTIKSITLDSGVEITIEQLTEIVEHIKNQEK